MATSDQRRQLAAIQAELLARKAMGSLRLFVELAWPILEPATPFLPNWHIDCVCEYLEAVTAGSMRRLVINMPPRYGKSLLVSVLWPAWEWAQRPSTRWLFVSYAESLAGRLSLDRRRLLTSDWYQQYTVASDPPPNVVLVEATANGHAVLSLLHQEIRGIIGVKPQGSKVARAAAVLPLIEAGQVYLPQPRCPDGRLRPEYAWVEDFMDACAAFPHGTDDDDVDALTQLLLRCQRPTGLSSGDIIRWQIDAGADGAGRDDGEPPDEVRYRGYKPCRG